MLGVEIESLSPGLVVDQFSGSEEWEATSIIKVEKLELRRGGAEEKRCNR